MAELKIFDRFEHYNHFHPESEGYLHLSFPASSLPVHSQLHRKPTYWSQIWDRRRQIDKPDRTSDTRRNGSLLNMGEREAPRTEGLAHSIDHPIDTSVDQSIQLKHPTRLVNSCKTYYYPFCIQKRSLVTHPCKTWIANLWFNFFMPTPTINFKSSRQLFFSDEHRIRKTSENTFAERREVVSLGAPRGTEIVAIRRYAKNITCFRLGSRRHCLMYISQGPDPIEHAWVRSFFLKIVPFWVFHLVDLNVFIPFSQVFQWKIKTELRHFF